MSLVQLKEAGFSDEEVSEYEGLLNAGFSEDEIEAHYAGKEKEPYQALEEQKPSFISKRTSNIAKDWTARPDEDVISSFTKTPGRIFRTVGQVAGGVNDIIGMGLVAGAKGLYSLVPEDAQRDFEATMSDVGKAIAPTIKTLSEAYGRGKRVYPELFGNIEATGNIIGLVPSAYLGTKTAKVADKAYDIAKGVITPTRTTEYFDKMIDEAVEYGFKKGIKPTVVGKSDAGLTKKFYDNAKIATKEIVERYPDNLPKNTEDFSKVVRQAKKDIWEESSTMAAEAGEKGAIVNIQPIRADLTAIIEAENVPQSAKRAAKIILNEIKSYADEVSPSVVENLIANFNSKTRNFWKHPDWNKADAPLQYERTANMLRKVTDDTIDAYKGPGWQDLRNRYGAQTAIEKAVTDRANVVARANVRGFFDLTDIFTTGEFLSALITHNPASLARAAAMYSAKKYAKAQNNVDRIIRKMFERVDDLSSQKPKPIVGSGYIPKVGPFVKSSAVDDMIAADMKMKRDIESDLLQGQYGEMNIPPRPPSQSSLEKALNAPDEYLATEGGALDSGLRISAAEREAMHAEAQQIRAIVTEGGQSFPPELSDIEILNRARTQGLDYRLGKQPGQPTEFAPLPTTDVRSGVLVGDPYGYIPLGPPPPTHSIPPHPGPKPKGAVLDKWRVTYRVPATGAKKRFVKVGGEWYSEVNGEPKGRPINSEISLAKALDKQLIAEYPELSTKMETGMTAREARNLFKHKP